MDAEERKRWLERLELARSQALAELRALDDAATAAMIEDVEALARRIRKEHEELVRCLR